MTIITLLGKTNAIEGKEFFFIGPLTNCQDCKLKNVCFNLEPGSKYRVVNIRAQEHRCHEYYGDLVVVVEVEKIPTPTAVIKKMAIEGSIITYRESKCGNVGCSNYFLCHAIGKKDGMKYFISSVVKDIKCPIGRSMVCVDLF